MNDALLQYGAIGVIAVMALAAVRVLFARVEAAYKREADRADRLEAELRSLNTLFHSSYSESLGDATKAVSDALATVRKEARDISRQVDNR